MAVDECYAACINIHTRNCVLIIISVQEFILLKVFVKTLYSKVNVIPKY